MNKFESKVREVPYSQESVYAKISDLNNLESVKDKLPADKIQDLSFDQDMLSFSVSPVGRITLRIVDREPQKCVKFETENSPLPFTLWIQVVSVNETSSKIKLTVQAELNPFIKGMVQKPLQEGLEKISEMLSLIPYN